VPPLVRLGGAVAMLPGRTARYDLSALRQPDIVQRLGTISSCVFW